MMHAFILGGEGPEKEQKGTGGTRINESRYMDPNRTGEVEIKKSSKQNKSKKEIPSHVLQQKQKRTPRGATSQPFPTVPPGERGPGKAWTSGRAREGLTPAPLPQTIAPSSPTTAMWEPVLFSLALRTELKRACSEVDKKQSWQNFQEASCQDWVLSLRSLRGHGPKFSGRELC